LCGIVGFTHRSWLPPSERIIAATATLVHRGPDQQSVYRSAQFSFGATRLKILDLQSGNQPFLSRDGNYGIIFNGEIYNHLELRSELEALGHVFQSHSDTETVLHAFLQWDKACLRRLRGMFAFAFWSTREKRLVLARDRMGIKPLYVAYRGEDIFFASELKALFVHPEFERRLSLQGLACYLALNYVPCPWTLVEGIEKLRPAHWLEWRNGAVSSASFWKLPYPSDSQLSFADAQEGLDTLLRQSVREHLLSDVPLGVWLSGGIDSSTILHYAAAEVSGSSLNTFSISYRGRSFDESKFIHSIVKRYGTKHEELDLSPEQDLAGATEELTYFSDEPSADAGALPVWFLSKLCKARTTVALSGEGADELFGGYLTYRANHLARYFRRLPPAAIRLLLSTLRMWPVSDEKIGFDYKMKRFLEGALLHPARAHVHWNGTFSDPEIRALIRMSVPRSLNAILSPLAMAPESKGDQARFSWFDQKYYLPDDILVKSDRMSMAHSVEVRPPFLDHRIVEFAASLPVAYKIQGSRQKVILKDLMRNKLPATIVNRNKIGLDIPAHDWLRGPLRSLLCDTVNEGLREYSDLFDPSELRSHMESHLSRRANLGYHLWGLMTLFLWMRKWHIQMPSTSSLCLLDQEAAGSPISSYS
jgi:asparagine synthase (glutamine-hydrolysing)